MTFAFELYQARKNVLEETVFKQLPQKLNFMAKDPIEDQYSKCLNSYLFFKAQSFFSDHNLKYKSIFVYSLAT